MIIADTVRCPTLPEHIRCDVHDVASAFKKFLSGLPGGILGSLALLDALISIQSQLAGQAEVTRTKQSKVRARLIALAVSTLRSQSRRELICAVFGLLCMIGRAAEITRREDDHGRPLPTSDLMGYSSLGIVFGPLLVGDLLEDYTMRLANPHGGLVLLPVSPPKSRKERQKKTKSGEEGSAFNTHVDKIKVANGITEMLITHWRDVVRHLKNLSALRNSTSTKSLLAREIQDPVLRPSASESFALRKPPDWGDCLVPPIRRERSESPTPPQRKFLQDLSKRSANINTGPVIHAHASFPKYSVDSLTVRKQRNAPRRMSNQRLSTSRSLNILSPTLEEDPINPNLLTVTPRLRRRRLEFDGSAYDPEDNDMLSSGAVAFAAGSASPRARAEVAPNEKNSINQTPLAVETHVPSTSSLPLVESVQNTHPKTPVSNARASVLEEVSQNHVERSVQFTSLKTLQSSPPISSQEPSKTSINTIDNDKIHVRSAVTMKLEQVLHERAKEVRRPAVRSTQIKLPAESPKNWHIGDQIALRRFGGSEPDLQLRSTANFHRRISKSLYEDQKRKRNLLDWSQIPATKDPLMRISQVEDSLSLAALSRALDIPEKKKSTGKLRKVKRSLTKGESPAEKNLDKLKRTPAQSSSQDKDDIRKSKLLLVRQRSFPDNAGPSELGPDERSHNISTQDVVGIKISERIGQLAKQTILAEPKLTHQPDIKQKPVTRSAVQSSGNGGNSKDIRPPTKTIRAVGTHSSSPQKNDNEAKAGGLLRSTLAGSPPKRSLLSDPVVTPTGSPRAAHMSRQVPGSPNKIAALVAKFNASNAIRPHSVPKLSPMSTPSRNRDSQVANRDRKESLLGPYRTNSPSPTKSQKSAKSIKSTESDWNSQSGRGSPHRAVTPMTTTVSNHSLKKISVPVQEPHLHVSLNLEWRNPEETPVPTPESTPKTIVLVSLNNLASQRSQHEDLADSGSLQRAISGKYSGLPQSYQCSVGLGDGGLVADSPLQNRDKAQYSGQLRWFSKMNPPGDAIQTSVLQQSPSKIKSNGIFLVEEFSGKPKSSDNSKQTQTESMPLKNASPDTIGNRTPGFECKQCPPKDSSKPPLNSRHSWPVPAVESRMAISNLDGPGSIGSTETSKSSTGSVGSLGITGNERVHSPGVTKTSIPLHLRSFPVTRQPFPPAHTLFPGAEDFVHPESPFSSLLLPPSSACGSPPSSGRISPIQDLIQDLRMSLRANREEIERLKQQLEEGLNAAKKEAEGWKKRALAAERRLEVYERPALPLRSSSKAGSLQKSYTSTPIVDPTRDEQAILNKGRNDLHGGNMDGAGTCHSSTLSLPDDNKETIAQVSECWSSEESTETVVRDTNSNVWSTENTVSIAQVEKELEEAGAF